MNLNPSEKMVLVKPLNLYPQVGPYAHQLTNAPGVPKRRQVNQVYPVISLNQKPIKQRIEGDVQDSSKQSTCP